MTYSPNKLIGMGSSMALLQRLTSIPIMTWQRAWEGWRGAEGRAWVGRRYWAVVPLRTRGRPWPREREGPTSAAQWEGWSVAEGRQGTTAQEPPRATKSHQEPPNSPRATKDNKGAQLRLSARELQGKVYLCIRHEENSIIDPFTAIRGVDTLRAGLGDHAGRPRRCGTSHGKPLQ